MAAANSDFIGGRTRIRTLDPLIKSQLLYQLSYAPADRGKSRHDHGAFHSAQGGFVQPPRGLRWSWCGSDRTISPIRRETSWGFSRQPPSTIRSPSAARSIWIRRIRPSWPQASGPRNVIPPSHNMLFGAWVFGVQRDVPIGAPWSIIVAVMQPA